MDGLSTYCRDLGTNPGADQLAIDAAQSHFGVTFPKDYIDFIKGSNGGEGGVGDHAYLVVWPIEELALRNHDYDVANLAPGLILFGSDGGGEAFAFDARSNNMSIVEVPFATMDLSDAAVRGTSFNEFLEYLYSFE